MGDSVNLTITFTNSAGTLLYGGNGSVIDAGLFNSGGVFPVAGARAKAGAGRGPAIAGRREAEVCRELDRRRLGEGGANLLRRAVRRPVVHDDDRVRNRLLAQVAKAQGRKVFAFTRPSDTKGQEFARQCGADWAGGSDQAPPEPLDAAIIFAPVGALVPQALAAAKKGGRLVRGGMHTSGTPALSHAVLWGGRRVPAGADLSPI